MQLRFVFLSDYTELQMLVQSGSTNVNEWRNALYKKGNKFL